MYYIKVPEPVVMVDLESGQVITGKNSLSLFRLVCDIAFSDGANFGDGWKAALAIQSIHAKLKDAKVGEIVALENDHYDRLRKSLLMEDPGRRNLVYDPKVLVQAMPILQAVKDAMTEVQYKKSLGGKKA